MDKITITRKDGLVYERKAREVIYDSKFTFRTSKEQIEKLKEICRKRNIGVYELIRGMIDSYIERNSN